MPRLVPATAAQKEERDLLTYEAWGDRLRQDEWLGRERRLRSHPWALETMETWLLEDAGAILASCESFRMHAHPQGHVFGIASVFTESSRRGQGHAGRMLGLLHRRLASRPLAKGTLLFSEVGPRLYERAGYQGAQLLERIIPASSREVGADWIPEGRVEEALSSILPPKDSFSVWPTALQIDWHLERERIYGDYLSRERPPWAGARIGEGIALWAADFRNECLAILLACARAQDEGESLLHAAAYAAHRAGLREVRLWESPLLPLGDIGISRPLEDLPMFHFFGEEAELPSEIPRALWV